MVPASQSATELALLISTFLTEHPDARVEHEGVELFNLRQDRYSVSAEHNRCLLHLWSDQQNLVRTVVRLQVRAQSLQVETKRLGQSELQKLTLKAGKASAEPSARKEMRREYLKRLMRQLSQQFEGRLDAFSTSLDMEQSLGPAYTRGLLLAGNSAWGIVGVNEQEDATTIANAVTVAILWLHACRERHGQRRIVEGVRLVLPRGRAQIARERMGWLNQNLAKWELYEWDESDSPLTPLPIVVEPAPTVALRPVINLAAVQKRLQKSLTQLNELLPKAMLKDMESRAESPTAMELRRNGLAFAWIEQRATVNGIGMEEHIGFGRGRIETELPPASATESETGLDREIAESELRDLAQRLLWIRQAEGNSRDPLYRLQLEKWLAAQLRRNLSAIDPRLKQDFVYEQLRALTLAESGSMEHSIAVTQKGQLAVLALCSEENPHWPLAALDCWMRARALQQSGEWHRQGYFKDMGLAETNPLLYLVSPVLRLHSSYPTVLSYFSKKIDWQITGLDERWRKDFNVILRRRQDSLAQIP